MEKLNELFELAKKATPGRNHDRLDSCGGGIKYQCLGNDGSLVLQCDHKNYEYGFIGPKSLEDEAFFLACKPEIIIAIAEAFRALEQRLGEMENQKPVGTVSIARDWNTFRNIATVNMRPGLVVAEMKDGDELFTRPAILRKIEGRND